MLRLLTAFNGWLERTFIGPRGYTVFADGHMERGFAPDDWDSTGDSDGDSDGAAAAVSRAGFRKVFGPDAELDGNVFSVPVIAEIQNTQAREAEPRQQGYMRGRFVTRDGQLTATAVFGTTRRGGVRLAPVYVWTCLVLILLDVLSGAISYAAGTLSGNDAFVIGLSGLSLALLMFAPRVAGVITDALLNDSRAPAIAKLSALVQHEGQG